MREAPAAIVAPLAILAALGTALALAGSSAGEAEPRQATDLESNVAVRAHLAPGGAVLSVERGCPPPAVLACRPGLRVTARAPSGEIVEFGAGWLQRRSPQARRAELASSPGVSVNSAVLTALLRDVPPFR